MRISIYQPRYFPQLHYFNRALNSDTFVLLNTAQYTKALVHMTAEGKVRHKSFQSDAVIKLPQGKYFLTLPLKHGGLFPISETHIDYTSKWPRSHSETIGNAYRKSANFSAVYLTLQEIIYKNYKTLGDINITSFLWGMSEILGLNLNAHDLNIDVINDSLKNSDFRLKKIILSSDLGVQRPEGIQKGTEWTIAICKKLGAEEYLHGGTAQVGYMDEKYYSSNGISTITQDWKCHNYPQQFMDKYGFIPNLSIIDIIMNADRKKIIEILNP